MSTETEQILNSTIPDITWLPDTSFRAIPSSSGISKDGACRRRWRTRWPFYWAEDYEREEAAVVPLGYRSRCISFADVQKGLDEIFLNLLTPRHICSEGFSRKSSKSSLRREVRQDLDLEWVSGLPRSSATGIYVAAVIARLGSQHAICFDAREEPIRIYDCGEDYAMVFSDTSLRVSSGEASPADFLKIDDGRKVELVRGPTAAYEASGDSRKEKRMRRRPRLSTSSSGSGKSPRSSASTS